MANWEETLGRKFGNLALHDKYKRSEEFTMVHGNNRVVQYQLRPENYTNYPTNGKSYEFNYMSNQCVFINGNQVANQNDNYMEEYSRKMQAPECEGEPFQSSLYGSYNNASNSWPQHSNFTAVGGSYPALPYSTYGHIPLYPAGAPQQAVTSSLQNISLGGSPYFGATTSYVPSEYLPLIRAPGEQLHLPEGNTHPSILFPIDPIMEGDDSEQSQKNTPTEDSPKDPIQLECPFLTSYGECQSKSSCIFQHPEGGVPTCVFNSVGLPLRPSDVLEVSCLVKIQYVNQICNILDGTKCNFPDWFKDVEEMMIFTIFNDLKVLADLNANIMLNVTTVMNYLTHRGCWSIHENKERNLVVRFCHRPQNKDHRRIRARKFAQLTAYGGFAHQGVHASMIIHAMVNLHPLGPHHLRCPKKHNYD
ncbi:hypothetical protein FRX31_013629 [Thalictrum thalictroides]|uniref:Zinc finger ccch domain-containing protein n=1 Tax=Thalictrum thalictroides TaxID=46969 RepID=A0A7J6WJZ1_THATH|nr:hypothetical protein FRX31_013629 [Thalictrum thalictroides]